jgi:glycogen debranching enzyme
LIAHEVEPDDVDEVIEKVARKIVEAKMETVAILSLEMMRPLSRISSQMGRIMVAPWFGIFGWDTMEKADMYMAVFEDRENVKRLIMRIEELAGEKGRKNEWNLPQEEC